MSARRAHLRLVGASADATPVVLPPLPKPAPVSPMAKRILDLLQRAHRTTGDEALTAARFALSLTREHGSTLAPSELHDVYYLSGRLKLYAGEPYRTHGAPESWWLRSRYRGKCRACGGRIEEGELVLWTPFGGGVLCERCAPADKPPPRGLYRGPRPDGGDRPRGPAPKPTSLRFAIPSGFEGFDT